MGMDEKIRVLLVNGKKKELTLFGVKKDCLGGARSFLQK
jgi:hypothetical protein